MTPKQKRFVQEYLVDLNATQAAIRAGYKEQSARITASKNLARPDIQAALRVEFDDYQKRTRITGDMVVEELSKIALAKADDYYRDYGLELKVSDKIRALELLGKHLGTFTERIAIAGPDPAVVAEVEALMRELDEDE